MPSRSLRKDWHAVRVHPGASMLQAMAVVSDGRMGIALVVDEHDRLLGTVTDGDMRRAILRQVGLDAPVTSVMEKHFAYASVATGVSDVLDMMRTRSIRQMPVCDDDGRVVGIHLLEDLLEPVHRKNWVVIMAGGRGRRLWPLTAYVPKPMLPVGGRPILDLILGQVLRNGFHHIFFSINYLGSQIVDYFGDGSRFGCTIEYLRETEPLGTGGALSLLPQAPEDPLLVMNGDLLTDVDLGELVDFHCSRGAAATVCVRDLTLQVPFGVVACDGEEVTGMEEKPVYHQRVNAGIYVLDPGLLPLVPRGGGEFQLPQLIHEARSKRMRVKAFLISGSWTDIGHLDEYQQVRDAGDGQEVDRP